MRSFSPPRNPSSRFGYSMIELLVSIAAGSMLLAGLAASMIISARAVSPPGEQYSVLKVAESSFIMADEMQSAVHVLQHLPGEIEFVVADRDADGSPEIIRYTWDSPTSTIQRHHAAAAGPIMDAVANFAAVPEFHSVSEILPGVVSESSVTTLAELTTAGDVNSWTLDAVNSAGQSLDIQHPVDTTLWSINQIGLAMMRSGSYLPGEVVKIQVREATGDGLPTSAVLAEATIPVSSLSTSFQPVVVPVTGAERLLRSQKVCVVILADDLLLGSSARVLYATSGFSDVGYMLEPVPPANDWTRNTGRSLYYDIQGTRHTVDQTSHEVVRNYVAGYNIEILHQDALSVIHRQVRLMNTPEELNGVWRLDFNVDPTGSIDADFDSIDDWQTQSGSALTGTPQYSVLPFADGELIETQIDHDFSGLITLDLKCRGTSYAASGGGAILQLPFGADTSAHGLLTITTERDSNGNQTARVMAADSGSEQTVALVRNLPDDQVEYRVVLDPAANNIAVWINDVLQGRTLVTQPVTGGLKKIVLGANGANAEFDFLSVRVGGTD